MWILNRDKNVLLNADKIDLFGVVAQQGLYMVCGWNGEDRFSLTIRKTEDEAVDDLERLKDALKNHYGAIEFKSGEGR